MKSLLFILTIFTFHSFAFGLTSLGGIDGDPKKGGAEIETGGGEAPVKTELNGRTSLGGIGGDDLPGTDKPGLANDFIEFTDDPYTFEKHITDSFKKAKKKCLKRKDRKKLVSSSFKSVIDIYNYTLLVGGTQKVCKKCIGNEDKKKPSTKSLNSKQYCLMNFSIGEKTIVELITSSSSIKFKEYLKKEYNVLDKDLTGLYSYFFKIEKEIKLRDKVEK